MRHTFAIVQITAAKQVTDNVKKMEAMMREAQEYFRAELILFPGTYTTESSRGMTRELRAETAEALDGLFVSATREPAARFSTWTAFGFYERAEMADSEGRNYNSALVLDDRGEICGHYRETHLYDAFGYRESDDYPRGGQLFRPVDNPFGKLGFPVCYEPRFPEAAQVARVGGVETLLMPSAWVRGNLKSKHFCTLFRARVVESTCYLFAANQYNKIRTEENAATGPMGVVTASAGE